MPFFATCSTDSKVQVVGPFDGIVEVTTFGFEWSRANNDENRWHVFFCDNKECVVEILNPVEAKQMITQKTGAINSEVSPPNPV